LVVKLALGSSSGSPLRPSLARQVPASALIDLDQEGKAVGLTIEHAMDRSGKLDFSYEATPA
jgi:hypothetical protein